jgi:hypothetical protein
MHPQDRSGGNSPNPSETDVVPLILSEEHQQVIRDDCLAGLYRVLGDLTKPDLLPDPVASAREGEGFRRLLEALDEEEVSVPDGELEAHFQRLSESFDLSEDEPEIRTAHDARIMLLRVLEGSGEDQEGVPSPGPKWLAGDQKDCRREVLDLLLSEAPNSVDFDEIALALAGDSENLGERDALRAAVTILVTAGLARREQGAFVPTRAAREMVKLGFEL